MKSESERKSEDEFARETGRPFKDEAVASARFAGVLVLVWLVLCVSITIWLLWP